MSGMLRRLPVLGVIGLAAALLGAGGALAGSSADAGDSQVVDISHQLGDMQKKLDDLQEKGRTAGRRQARGRGGLRVRRAVAGLRAVG